MMKLCLLLAATLPLSSAHLGVHNNLRLESSSVVAPIKFNQRLLLCNAYPSQKPVAVAKNGQRMNFAVEFSRGLGFDECAYAPADVLAKDKLDFTLEESGIQGTFEVGDLPESDAVLLLVLQRRDEKSPLMSFQSFAFPMNSGADEAHLAVIDASVGLSKAHLKVQDLAKTHTPKKESRPEELGFNRIYALEPGAYSFSIQGEAKEENYQEASLEGKHDYVVIRTGKDGRDHLVTFPQIPVQSAAAHTGVALPVALGFLLTALFVQ